MKEDNDFDDYYDFADAAKQEEAASKSSYVLAKADGHEFITIPLEDFNRMLSCIRYYGAYENWFTHNSARPVFIKDIKCNVFDEKDICGDDCSNFHRRAGLKARETLNGLDIHREFSTIEIEDEIADV